MSAVTQTESRRDARKIQANVQKLLSWAGGRHEPMPPANLVPIRDALATDIERLARRAEVLEQTPALFSVQVEDDETRTVTIDMRDGTMRTFQTPLDYFTTPPSDYRLADAAASVERAQEETERARQEAREANSRTEYMEEKLAAMEARHVEAMRVINQSLPGLTIYLDRERVDLIEAGEALYAAVTWMSGSSSFAKGGDVQKEWAKERSKVEEARKVFLNAGAESS